MLRLITMHDGRKLGLRQAGAHSVPINVKLSVLRAVAAGTYTFTFTVRIQPVGTDGTLGTLRLAAANEVYCMVQYPWGMANWTDFYGAVATNANGQATVTVASSSMRFPSKYQAYALHIASAAEEGLPFNIDASGNVTLGTPYVIAGGKTQAATFQKGASSHTAPNSHVVPGRSSRSLAFPETRTYPFAGLHQVRRIGGIAFPEVRQWPNSGPNPALPGRLIRVRQDDGGPAYRMVTI